MEWQKKKARLPLAPMVDLTHPSPAELQWWVTILQAYQENPEPVMRLKKLVAPLLLSNQPTAVPHPGQLLLYRLLADDEIVSFLEGPGIRPIEDWWKNTEAPEDGGLWYAQRCKDPYYIRVALGLVLLRPDTFGDWLRRNLSAKGFIYRVIARDRGQGYLMTLTNTNAQHMHTATLSFRRMETAYLTILSRTIHSFGPECWRLFSRPGVTDMDDLLCRLYTLSAHHIYPRACRDVALQISRDVTCEESHEIMAYLAYGPIWSLESLRELFRTDPRCQSGQRSLDPILRALGTVHDLAQWCRVEVVPLETPFHFRLLIQWIAPQASYSTSLSATIGRGLSDLGMVTFPVNFPFPILTDMEAKNLSVQQIFNMACNTRELKHAPSTDPLLPLVRGTQEQGLIHYPIILPAELKTRILTTGQVCTQEFMAEREAQSFLDLLGPRVTSQGGMEYLVTPYLPHVIYALPAAPPGVRSYRGGIIADHTGTGKTLSVLLRCIATPGETSIVVIPDVLMHHWSSEVSKHTTLTKWEDAQYMHSERVGPEPVAKRARILVEAAHRYDCVVLHRTQDLLRHTWDQMPRLVLVSHSTTRSKGFAKYLGTPAFTRLVVDEAHSLGPTTVRNINGLHRDCTWLITATPYSHVDEIFRLLLMHEVITWVINGTVRRGTEDPEVPRLRRRILPMIYRFCMTRKMLDRTRLHVNVVKQYCDMTPEETSFFREIAELVEKNVLKRCPTHLHRFFRVMERLGAGGYIHRRLILQILQRIFTDSLHVTQLLPMATEEAFGASTDDCTVCLCPLIDPVQTVCRHVYCRTCLQSMWDLRMRRCAFCRQDLGTRMFLPCWGSSAAATSAEDTTTVVSTAADPAARERALVLLEDNDSASVSHRDYRVALAGSSEEMAAQVEERVRRELLNLQGKMMEIGRQLDAFIQQKQPGDQLVMFTKEQMSSSTIIRMIQVRGLSVLCAGVMNCRKLVSVANIERFRQGQSDVLLVSNRYCDGFDLFMAKEIWLLNTDLSAARMEQSQGRIVRVAQKHENVVVRVFVYRDTFDDFLWDFRRQIDIHANGFNKTHLLLFYYHCRRNVPDTLAYRIQRVVNRVWPQGFTGNISVIAGELVFGRLRFSLKTASVNSPWWHRRLDEIEAMADVRELHPELM